MWVNMASYLHKIGSFTIWRIAVIYFMGWDQNRIKIEHVQFWILFLINSAIGLHSSNPNSSICRSKIDKGVNPFKSSSLKSHWYIIISLHDHISQLKVIIKQYQINVKYIAFLSVWACTFFGIVNEWKYNLVIFFDHKCTRF